MQYISGSLNNNCDKWQEGLEDVALVVHTKHQHYGLYIFKETSHSVNTVIANIQRCAFMRAQEFNLEKKKNHMGTTKLFKITEQEKQH